MKNSASNNRDLPGLRGPSHAATTPELTTKQPPTMDPRFKSPAFRAAVRKVLSYLGLDMTYLNFQKYDARHKAGYSIAWYEMARNIGISSKQDCTLVDGSTPVSGGYFETTAGKLIDVGTCLESIKELTECNRRLK